MTSEGLARLDVWRKAKEFAVRVYRDVIPNLPAEEKWGLGLQLRRAAQSIPANIAEGYGRFYYQDNIRFAYIARGSLEECLSHLSLAFELGFIPEVKVQAVIQKGDDLDRLICGYIAYLKKSRRGEKEPGSLHPLQEPSPEYRLEDGQQVEETDLGSLFSDLDSPFSDLDSPFSDLASLE